MLRAARWSILFFVLLSIVRGTSAQGRQQAPHYDADRSPPIEVAVTCVELDLIALRSLGVTLDSSKVTMEKLASEKPAELLAMVDGFAKAGCARAKYSPRVSTLSGREARVEIGPSRITTTPVALEDGRIRVDVSCQFRRPVPAKYVSLPPTWVKFGVDLGLVAHDGETVCLTHPGNTKMAGDSPEDQLVAFIFLTARRHTDSPVDANRDVAPARYAEAPPQTYAPATTPAQPPTVVR